MALAGDKSIKRYNTGAAYRQILIEILAEYYPLDHKVALYECPTLAIDKSRIDWISLSDFAHAHISLITTMVLPPSKKMLKTNEY